MKKVSYDDFARETNKLLEDYAIENQCHVGDLHPDLVSKVLHFRSEMWIDYKKSQLI